MGAIPASQQSRAVHRHDSPPWRISTRRASQRTILLASCRRTRPVPTVFPRLGTNGFSPGQVRGITLGPSFLSRLSPHISLQSPLLSFASLSAPSPSPVFERTGVHRSDPFSYRAVSPATDAPTPQSWRSLQATRYQPAHADPLDVGAAQNSLVSQLTPSSAGHPLDLALASVERSS